MRNLYFTFLLMSLFFSIHISTAQYQPQSEIKFYYGITNSKLIQESDLIGGPGYHVENSLENGIRYIWHLPNGIGLETGVNFWQGDVIISSAPMPEITERTEKLEVTSIPIFINYAFWNFFFLNAGPVMDFQSSDSTFPSQSGIGFGAGLGAQYSFNRFLVYVNPNFRKNAIIPFEKESHHPRLTTFGIQFGLGYRF